MIKINKVRSPHAGGQEPHTHTGSGQPDKNRADASGLIGMLPARVDSVTHLAPGAPPGKIGPMEELAGRGFTMRPKHDGTQTTYVVYDPVDSFRSHRARALKEHLRKDAYTIAAWTDDQGPTWLDVGCDSLDTAIALLEVHWQGWIHIDAIRSELGRTGILDRQGLHRYREAWLKTR